MTTRLLQEAQPPFSNSIKLKMRTLFKQGLGLASNASEAKLAQAIGVPKRLLYNYLAQDYNNYVRNENEKILAERRQKALEKRRRLQYVKQISDRVDYAIKRKSNEIININVNADRLGDMRLLLNKLVKYIGSKLTITVNDKIYTLNPLTIRNLITLLDDRILLETEEFDSNKEIIKSIEEIGDFTISILPTVGLPKVEGGLFPYTHKLDALDLKRYAIYHEKTEFADEINDNNCLITALKACNINTEILNCYVKNQYIPQTCLKEIALKIKHQLVVKKEGSKNLRKYGNPTDPIINLGLIENHYFIIEPTVMTSYSIKNYFNIDKEKYPMWYKIDKIGCRGKYVMTDKTIDSYKLIKLLLENKETHLSRFKGLEIYKMNNYKKYEEDIFTSLEYCNLIHYFEYNKKKGELEEFNPEGNLEKNEPKHISDKNRLLGIDFFDFETTTKRDDGIIVKNNYVDTSGNIIIHKPYLLGSSKFNCIFYGEKCGKQYLDALTKKYGINIEDYPSEKTDRPYFMLIAHNAGYDFRFLFEYFDTIKTIEKGTGLMSAKCEYYYTSYVNKTKVVKKLVFVIRDSLKMINMPLSKFSSAFNLDVKKEILPYDLYTEENLQTRYINIDICLKYVNDDDKDEYLKNVKMWDCYDAKNKTIDIILYSSKYCQMDCKTLEAGYYKFRELCMEAINLDIINYISLASMADDYLKIQGCYNEVLKISGIPRAFIQKCVVGGRTMCCENKKSHIKGRDLADFDAVSLYPSAMARMEGFLKGEPKVIKNFEPDKYDGYFVCIRITKIGKCLKFPLCSYVNENGVRIFSNDMIGKIIYVDKISLEDLIKYQKIEYEFINGYYYDEGFNNKINKTIKYLFEQRLKYKKEKNPLQLVFKECMNSSYGKSYMKPIETEDYYVKNDEYVAFINRNYNSIKQATKLANRKGFKITKMKPVDNHYNNAHVGVEILSMSKRIMNEVMCLAEDLKISMFYQDTDSIHLFNDSIELLSNKYKEKYNRDLIGINMGQFHTDFDMKGSVGEIVAVESIFLAKKAYIDKLKSKDKDGNIIYDYHIRMKGVPDSSIKYLADKEYDGNIFKIYEELYNSKSITFDLVAVKPKFELKRDMNILSKSNFNRNVRF